MMAGMGLGLSVIPCEALPVFFRRRSWMVSAIRQAQALRDAHPYQFVKQLNNMLESGFVLYNFCFMIKHTLRLILLPSVILSIVVGCAHVGANSPKASIELFNGKNLDGWTIQNKGKFSVEDGVIKINRGTGWLRSVETFADFKLVMEFRFMEKGANSGIFVRTGPKSTKKKEGWPKNGYQIQCKDTITEDRALGTMIPYGAPPFEHESDRAAIKKAYKPMGEWHTYEITLVGETLEVKLNGILVTTATSIKNLDGHIGIQGEKGLLEFRKIVVFPL